MSEPPWFRRYPAGVWCLDFEFAAPAGCNPEPLCVVARDVRGGRLVRRWLDGESCPAPPYPVGPDALLVAYYASAEWGATWRSAGRPRRG